MSFPYISPYLSSITCGCVQNTVTDAASSLSGCFAPTHVWAPELKNSRSAPAPIVPRQLKRGLHRIFVKGGPPTGNGDRIVE